MPGHECRYALKKSTERSATSPCGSELIRPVRCHAGEALARTAYCLGAPDGHAHGEADAIDAVFLILCHTRTYTPAVVGQILPFVRVTPIFPTLRAPGSDAPASAGDA